MAEIYPEDVDIFICNMCGCYDGFHENGYECYCECCCGEVTCPFGYSEDEDCGVEYRAGIETCEFLCPFNRLSSFYKSLAGDDQ